MENLLNIGEVTETSGSKYKLITNSAQVQQSHRIEVTTNKDVDGSWVMINPKNRQLKNLVLDITKRYFTTSYFSFNY